MRPHTRRYGQDLVAADVATHRCGNVWLDDPSQLLQRDTSGGIDVALWAVGGGREMGELLGRIPVERALSGHRTRQVPEHW